MTAKEQMNRAADSMRCNVYQRGLADSFSHTTFILHDSVTKTSKQASKQTNKPEKNVAKVKNKIVRTFSVNSGQSGELSSSDKLSPPVTKSGCTAFKFSSLPSKLFDMSNSCNEINSK
jgi:hypothetical protein